MKAGVTATKLAIGAFIIPYMFVVSPELVLVDVHIFDLFWILPGAVLGMFCVSSGIQGWFLGKIGFLSRILLTVSGLLLIDPGFYTDIFGGSIILIVFLIRKLKH